MMASLPTRPTLVAIVLIGLCTGFWLLHNPAIRQHQAPIREQLALKQESVDALSVENQALAQRLKALTATQHDREALIKLKTTRLNRLQPQP